MFITAGTTILLRSVCVLCLSRIIGSTQEVRKHYVLATNHYNWSLYINKIRIT